MIYSNLTGTTGNEFTVGKGKSVESKIRPENGKMKFMNKDGNLIPLSGANAQSNEDFITKGQGDSLYATKAQGNKADTALQQIQIGTVTKGDEASATASTSGTTTTLNLVLPKGDPGENGQDGAKGDPGTAAGFGTPTATATTLEPGQTATVNVETSGDNTAKIFKFTFGIPKGATGAQGPQGNPGADGQDGTQGPQGNPGVAAGFGTPASPSGRPGSGPGQRPPGSRNIH